MDYQLGPGPLQVDQNTIDEKIKGDIGIVENGDVATHAIPNGYYVIWKGDLYVAKTDISSGTTLSTSNLTAKPNGIGAEVAKLNSDIINSSFVAGGTRITTATDFHTFVTPGVYRFDSNTIVSSSVNKPCNFAGKLIVWSINNANLNTAWGNGGLIYRDYYGTEYVCHSEANGSGDITWGNWSSLNSNLTYKSGDAFAMRSYHTIGRVVNSGQGLFCWLDLAKPCSATGASITFGNNVNIFGIGSATPTKTVSMVGVNGNQLSFVIDLSSSHTAGEIGIAEFEAQITLT